jgi:DNA polymerase elongation subunit (family B)
MVQVAIKQKQKAEEIINSVLNKDVITEPETFVVRVLRLAMNKNYVYADLNGTLIEVFHPRYREKSVGRTITVVRSEDDAENRYKLLNQ